MLRKTMLIKVFVLLLVCVMFIGTTAEACTSIRLITTDGKVFYARTMEFYPSEGDPAHPDSLSVVPAGTMFFGVLPDGTQKGLVWTAKYGFVGMNSSGRPVVADGMNEKGLVVGELEFPGYAGYQEYKVEYADRTLSQYEVATWILGNFANIQEVRQGIEKIRVSSANNIRSGSVDLNLSFHYAVHDKDGDSLVIEYVNGELKLYDNPLGVLTNAPTFDWMQTNLKNYINIKAFNAPAVKIADVTASGFGQGTGMLGLPGDFTPPSRFVRMMALTQSALPVTGSAAGLNLAMTIINNVDIPVGAVRDNSSGKTAYDRTLWTVAADLQHQRYYFRNYDNNDWRYVDVAQALSGATQVMTIPVFTAPEYKNITNTRVNFTNYDPALYKYQDR